MNIHSDRQTRLLAMAREDETVRNELMRSGELFQGYHPRMEAVHLANARELESLLESGALGSDGLGSRWPSVAEVGEEAQRAAWLIVQHAISLPQFQRRCLALLEAALERGEVPAWQVAMLTDRIRVLEGRPQRYGTQFDWDESGQIAPKPIEDPARVDELRARAGLEPLAEALARHRRDAAKYGEHAPAHRAEREAQADAWARRVGWR